MLPFQASTSLDILILLCLQPKCFFLVFKCSATRHSNSYLPVTPQLAFSSYSNPSSSGCHFGGKRKNVVLSLPCLLLFVLVTYPLNVHSSCHEQTSSHISPGLLIFLAFYHDGFIQSYLRLSVHSTFSLSSSFIASFHGAIKACNMSLALTNSSTLSINSLNIDRVLYATSVTNGLWGQTPYKRVAKVIFSSCSSIFNHSLLNQVRYVFRLSPSFLLDGQELCQGLPSPSTSHELR